MKIIPHDFRSGANRDQTAAVTSLVERLDEMLTTPVGFAEGVLGLRLYPWQDEVLAWFEEPRRRVQGALVTPNGAGKSSGVVAALALWWISAHERGRVVITTKDSKQLDQQLLPALERHKGTFARWKWNSSPYPEITTPTGGRIVAFTTNDAGRAEGWHKEDDTGGPLLIIVDEAKSVEEGIFQAIDRCTYNALLYVSSPGLMLGPFYDAFTKRAALFRRRQVSLEECPHIPREKVEGIIAKYGADHPFTLSSVHGQFMSQDAANAFVFSLAEVQKATQRAAPPKPHDRSAFCDFAAGGDENVLAIRTGARVEIAAAWREADTQSAIGRFILEFRKAGLEAHEIFADEGGLGRPMVDQLAARGWPINRVNFGSPALDGIYENRGAELWHETAASLMRSELAIPDDAVLVAQLTTRRVKVTSNGRLGLESKADLRARGGDSPDRADALCGAWMCRSWQSRPRTAMEELSEELEAEEDTYLAGMNAG